MILRSALAFGMLAASAGLASAQYYPPQQPGAYPPPPYGQQAYPPYRPVPGAAIPDDDDDIPQNQLAMPGSAPPPPGGYRGPVYNSPRGQQVERDTLPPPGSAPAPYYGNQPSVVYGDRYPDPRAPQYGRAPVGGGQPESYGSRPGYPPNQAAVPQGGPYGVQPAPEPYQQQGGYQPGYQQPQQGGPMQLRPQGDVGGTARDNTGSVRPNSVATLPPEDQPETGKFELPPQFKRQIVNFQSAEPAGTLVIDTANTHLYLVLGNGQAMRYGIGVGREGFTWAGAERVSRMAEWPDWHPPAEMIERQPYLPRFMAGGEGNPLGARALYLGKTLYRIHGTNQPSTIGKYVSSGCIRLTNEDIQDLYSRVQVGTRVVVLPGNAPPQPQASNEPLPQQQPVRQR